MADLLSGPPVGVKPVSDHFCCTRNEFGEALRAHLNLPKEGLMGLKFEFGDAATDLLKVHATYALPQSFIAREGAPAVALSEVSHG